MNRHYDIFDFLLDLPTSQASNTADQKNDLMNAVEFILKQNNYYAELIPPPLEINGEIDSDSGSLAFLSKKKILFNKISFDNKIDFNLDLIKNEKSPLIFYNESQLFKIEPFAITKDRDQFILFNDINESKNIDVLKGQVLINFKFNVGNIEFINSDILIELFPNRFQNTLVAINIDKFIRERNLPRIHYSLESDNLNYEISGTFFSYSLHIPFKEENGKIIRYNGLYDLNRGKRIYCSYVEATKYRDYPYQISHLNAY